MKNHNSAFLFLLIISCAVYGFVSETGKIKKINYSVNSPLDLSAKIKNSDNQKESRPENSAWYSESMTNIKKSEYKVSFDEDLNAYQSPNRANNMRFIYHKDGFTATLRSNKTELFDESDESDKMIVEKEKKYKYLDDWKIKFKLECVRKDINSDSKNYTDFSHDKLITEGNKISIENEDLRIQYYNDEFGMRQDFIIKIKPAGEGSLRLNLKADTKLKMILGADALMFKDNERDIKLKYSSLKCWDANGKELRAYFEKSNYELLFANDELNEKSKIIANSKFSIVVNDYDAVYPITIDPLSSTPDWTAEINQAGANLGWSVATAGDVNGDGYSDVIAGAPYYDNGQTDEGGVFVYYGSSVGLSLAANWTKENNQASALFGWSVATAGDVNGDGYSDVIIGSPAYDSIQTDEGRAYIYYGSLGGLQSAFSWKYENNQSGENFGYCVASAGDMNNDGYSDVIVGSPFYDGSMSNEGRVYMFKGSSGGLSISPDWTYKSNQADANLGFNLATAGDLNGDGFSDLIIGAYKYNSTFSNDGRVYIFYSSGVTFTSSPSTTRSGTQAGEYFGYCVSTAGDVNGDGYSDIIIGAPLFDNGQTDEGKCYAYLGSASGIGASPFWTKESNEAGGQLGISVSTAGDMNGDGYADVITGGNFLDNGEADEGRAFVYLGYSNGLSNSSAVIYECNQANSNFGYSVAIAGDINGDGLSDVIIGAYSFNSSDEGKVFLYLGSADSMSTISRGTLVCNQGNANFGVSVSSAGDINGDGFSDVIIGANQYDNGHTNEGAAFVFHGSASGLSATPNWSSEGNQNDANFGNSVSTAGDINGDGYSDVIIGSSFYDNGHSNEGAVFVFQGSVSGLSATANWSSEGNQIDANFGNSVSTAGDVNGDGFSDVIIGAYRYDNGETDEGCAFVYQGSSSGLSLTADWISEGNQTSAFYGYSVSNAGDVNGDGYSDVIAGAELYSNGHFYEGAAFVYHGSDIGLSNVSNWSAEGNQINKYFGFKVKNAGDVNGDGYSDILVGAIGSSVSVNGVFAYYGSSSGLSGTSNWNINSFLIESRYWSCSTAGDVNGDGYSDIIVGDYSNDFNQEGEGAAFIYSGSATGLSSNALWTARGGILYGYFGNSVSSAGDVNGDGYSDVIVASYGIITNPGKAFVYYGGVNDLNSIRSTVNQYKFGTSNIVSSDGITGAPGSVRLQHFAKSPFGKGTGRVVYDIQPNGIPFTGSIISRSTLYNSNPPAYSNLGLTGTNVSQDMSGFNFEKQYKWRARVQYKMTNFPFQKYGPWRYYNNFSSESPGGFRPRTSGVILNMTMCIEGFYNSDSDLMISDSVKIILRNAASPFVQVDSLVKVMPASGNTTYNFQYAVNSVPYYVILKHRNSIETWSSTPQTFTSNNLNYNFTTDLNKAYGNNQKLVDSSPVKFGIYSGDINQDGTIDAGDLSHVENAAANSESGYVQSDVNGDDYADAADLSIVENNAAAGVNAVTP